MRNTNIHYREKSLANQLVSVRSQPMTHLLGVESGRMCHHEELIERMTTFLVGGMKELPRHKQYRHNRTSKIIGHDIRVYSEVRKNLPAQVHSHALEHRSGGASEEMLRS